jgi:transcriptional regulator with XRE-family HTH domain
VVMRLATGVPQQADRQRECEHRMNESPPQTVPFPPLIPRARATSSPHASTAVSLHGLGERVRMARCAANLTQQELAGQTYSKSYISAVERGKMLPSLSSLRLLAERPVVPEEPTQEEAGAVLLRHAEALLERGCYEEAAATLRQGLEEAGTHRDAHTRGRALATLVAAYTAQKEYAHALAMARPALDALDASQDHGTAGLVQLLLATIHAATHDEAAAEHDFQEAIGAWAKAAEQSWLSHAHEQYWYFLAARKRYQEAYEQMRLAQVQCE